MHWVTIEDIQYSVEDVEDDGAPLKRMTRQRDGKSYIVREFDLADRAQSDHYRIAHRRKQSSAAHYAPLFGSPHPNIVFIDHVSSECDGKGYVFHEDFSGWRRLDRLSPGELELKQHVLAVLEEIAETLDFFHKLQLFTGHLCLRNVLVPPPYLLLEALQRRVARQSIIKLKDFGLAITASAPKNAELPPELRESLNPSGISFADDPEHPLNTSKGWDFAKSDQYQLALIAKQLLLPHLHQSQTHGASDDDPILFSESEEPGPVTVYSVLEKGLAYAKHERFKSCKAFVDALSDALYDPFESKRPYHDLFRCLDALAAQVHSGPDHLIPEVNGGTTKDSLLELVNTWKRKPMLALAGRYDSGKTTLANRLLGGAELPTGDFPTTKIMTIIRHIEDRPSWQADHPVWIMGSGFDPRRWREGAHFRAHLLDKGDLQKLWEYGTHESAIKPTLDLKQSPFAAIVYMDAPILRSCCILDLPGIGHSKADTKIVYAGIRHADAVIYTALRKGGFDEMDSGLLADIVDCLPRPEQVDRAFPVLGNLFLTVTGVNENNTRFYKRAVARLHELFETWKESVDKASGWPDECSIAEHLFISRRSLQDALDNVLTASLPRVNALSISTKLQALCSDASSNLECEITKFKGVMADVGKAREELQELNELNRKREQDVATLKNKVARCVAKGRRLTASTISNDVQSFIAEKQLELLIRQRFQSKAAAEATAIAAIVRGTGLIIDGPATSALEEFDAVVSDFISFYSLPTIDQHTNKVELNIAVPVPADVRGVVGAVLGGTAGVGAGIAATATAAGHALLGVGLTVGTVLAPLGLGLIALIGVWSLIRKPWQERLALQIAEELQTRELVKKMLDADSESWDRRLTAFENLAQTLENDYQKRKKDLQDRLDQLDAHPDSLGKRIAELLQSLAFFNGLTLDYVD